MRTSSSRALLRTAAKPSTLCRAASGHAISNPTLANIEKRWESMPSREQADLWMALRDRMKDNWNNLTLAEKKAAYFLSFGPHGPRALPPADEGRNVLLYTVGGLLASLAIFGGLRTLANPPPPTMTKEYQEATNEFLKAQNSDPLTGISSEGYSGKGMVQSPSGKP
ncbi:cytochrome c oxidase polypeptide 5 [Schizothecium vesticola]|uniref:Cytochrome c oxidase polypeptide V n=1 Tax=Schizothecium vesticola TaxID=314040 RepID=A0AA40EJT9_9PEZI|nr:cytochrome c oxidase polypeptide 5 [Schizothecium vesticola]